MVLRKLLFLMLTSLVWFSINTSAEEIGDRVKKLEEFEKRAYEARNEPNGLKDGAWEKLFAEMARPENAEIQDAMVGILGTYTWGWGYACTQSASLITTVANPRARDSLLRMVEGECRPQCEANYGEIVKIMRAILLMPPDEILTKYPVDMTETALRVVTHDYHCTHAETSLQAILSFYKANRCASKLEEMNCRALQGWLSGASEDAPKEQAKRIRAAIAAPKPPSP